MLDTIKHKAPEGKGADSEFTIAIIAQSCRELFPLKDVEIKKKCAERELAPSELENLQWTEGNSSYVTGPYFSVRIYNGNKNINLTSATIEISNPIPANQFTQSAAKVSRQQYDLFFSKAITPKSADSLGQTILELPRAGWSWKVVSVKTCS